MRTAWHLADHLLRSHGLPIEDAIAAVLPPLDAELAKFDRRAEARALPKATQAAPAPEPTKPGGYWRCPPCSPSWSGPFGDNAKLKRSATRHVATAPDRTHRIETREVAP